jgi:RNA polymerase sigma factor (sigma-70 family)
MSELPSSGSGLPFLRRVTESLQANSLRQRSVDSNMTDGGGPGFPVTRHSVIARIRDVDADGRRDAFDELVRGYWKPVYKHLRVTWRLAPEDAQDLTQGFFTEAFDKAWLERFEPGKARFRTFVRVCADRFVMNNQQSASRQKRGGGVFPVDFETAEREMQHAALSVNPDPDEFFHQEFVRALFERAVAAVRRECEETGRTTHFALFERYDLNPQDGDSYGALAAECGLTTTQVTNWLAHARRRFRAHALDELRGLCGSDEEFDREARDLFGIERR